ncbi:MAG TPA: hypothetical protein PLD23_03370 [Armatimonadota bacterium]|mgnify:FL=1|nr:hypothetical protein [Armatimonadota bacterium]HQK92515.1 hypothetical protein [Armatimonadota bacterium]
MPPPLSKLIPMAVGAALILLLLSLAAWRRLSDAGRPDLGARAARNLLGTGLAVGAAAYVGAAAIGFDLLEYAARVQNGTAPWPPLGLAAASIALGVVLVARFLSIMQAISNPAVAPAPGPAPGDDNGLGTADSVPR